MPVQVVSSVFGCNDLISVKLEDDAPVILARYKAGCAWSRADDFLCGGFPYFDRVDWDSRLTLGSEFESVGGHGETEGVLEQTNEERGCCALFGV